MKRILSSLVCLTLLAALVGCERKTPVPPRPPTLPSAEQVDVESRDLPPDEEIVGLLKGARGLGRPSRVVRVAVPPFRVIQGKGREVSWVGEAASEVVAAGLSRVEGVSVLERGELARLVDELRKEEGEENASKASSSGKILGAQHLVLGSLLPIEGDTYRLIVRPVRVEDGVVLPSVQTNLKTGSWESLQTTVEGVVAQLGLKAPAGPALMPLSPYALEQVARARELQYRGELEKAQKLYSKALETPSSAWRAEADYLLVMAELGMREWVQERSKRVLAQMPRTLELACDRARLLAQAARHEYRVDEMREAVRAAASCGDRAVIAQSLGYFGSAMRAVHQPTAAAAFASAQERLGPGEDFGVTRCWLQIEQESLRVELLQNDSDQGERWEKVGRACRDAGARRLAAYALRSAAWNTVESARRRSLFEQSIEQARKIGGVALDQAYLGMAGEERSLGHIIKADELLLEQMAARLRALVELQGGISEIEGRLDRELLARLGIQPTPGRTDVDTPTQLQIQIHRRGLASGLRQWANRTRPESKRQAAFYDEVAAALDPPAIPEGSQPQERFEQRMAAARLSLGAIGRNERPLRGSGASPAAAFDAIFDRFWALCGDDAPTEQLAPLVQAARTLAGWREHSGNRFNAFRMEAELRNRGGSPEAALGLLRGAESLARSPRSRDQLLTAQAVIVGRQNNEQAAALYDQAAAAVEKISPIDWVWRSYSREHLRVASGKGADSSRRLLEISSTLVRRGLIEPAALAMTLAAALENSVAHANGTPEAIAIYRQRAQLLASLGDPIRSAEALADQLGATYDELFHRVRGRAGDDIEVDPRTAEIVQQVRPLLRQLIDAGKYRDAVRLVTRISYGVKDLIGPSFEWSERFKDSSEYPELMGRLHHKKAALMSSGKNEAFAVSHAMCG